MITNVKTSINNKLYENFHKNTNLQLRLINKNNFTYKIIVELLNRYIISSKKILDIGCGAGTVSLYLASKNNDVTGIDISQSAIQACKSSASNLSLQTRTSFKIMNFPKETPQEKFDVITCFEVIEHLPDDRLALARIYSLLKPNGLAIISTPSRNAPLYKLGLARKFDKRVGHLRRYTMDSLKRMAEKAGFEIIATYKTEGVVRNFLFLNPLAGKLLIFIRGFITHIITLVDNISLKLFGESDLILVLKKQ